MSTIEEPSDFACAGSVESTTSLQSTIGRVWPTGRNQSKLRGLPHSTRLLLHSRVWFRAVCLSGQCSGAAPAKAPPHTHMLQRAHGSQKYHHNFEESPKWNCNSVVNFCWQGQNGDSFFTLPSLLSRRRLGSSSKFCHDLIVSVSCFIVASNQAVASPLMAVLAFACPPTTVPVSILVMVIVTLGTDKGRGVDQQSIARHAA